MHEQANDHPCLRHGGPLKRAAMHSMTWSLVTGSFLSHCGVLRIGFACCAAPRRNPRNTFGRSRYHQETAHVDDIDVTVAASSSAPEVLVPPDDARIERAMIEGSMAGNSLRLLALAIWPLFWMIRGGSVPWWSLAIPAAIHIFSMGGLLWVAYAYRRNPDRHELKSWRLRHTILVGLTGVAYGVAGLLLLPEPPAESRMLAAAILLVVAAVPPGRTYEPIGYALLVCLDLLPTATTM